MGLAIRTDYSMLVIFELCRRTVLPCWARDAETSRAGRSAVQVLRITNGYTGGRTAQIRHLETKVVPSCSFREACQRPSGRAESPSRSSYRSEGRGSWPRGYLVKTYAEQTEVIVSHGPMLPHHNTCSATQCALCRARGRG